MEKSARGQRITSRENLESREGACTPGHTVYVEGESMSRAYRVTLHR